MKRRSLALLLSLIIGICYYGFCSRYFFGTAVDAADTGEAAVFAGSILAGALVTPHIALGWIAVVLNLVAFLANSRGCALAAVILFAVSAVIFLMYALFVVPEVVLSIIGYVRLNKINAKNRAAHDKKGEPAI